MKEIELIKYELHSIDVPPEAIGLHGIEGKCSIDISKLRSSEMARIQVKNLVTGETLGEADVAGGDKELAQARKNGSQVIYATIAIENLLGDIITNYLFGKFKVDPKREFFVNEILNTSHIAFATKKALVLKIIDELKFFGSSSDMNSKRKKDINKKKGDFDRHIVEVMNYRNAFAHGKLRYESNRGCVLQFYSGGHKEHVLDDKFWTKIEEQYDGIEKELRKILKLIHSRREGPQARF
jgi:hypothetical protein